MSELSRACKLFGSTKEILGHDRQDDLGAGKELPVEGRNLPITFDIFRCTHSTCIRMDRWFEINRSGSKLYLRSIWYYKVSDHCTTEMAFFCFSPRCKLVMPSIVSSSKAIQQLWIFQPPRFSYSSLALSTLSLYSASCIALTMALASCTSSALQAGPISVNLASLRGCVRIYLSIHMTPWNSSPRPRILVSQTCLDMGLCWNQSRHWCFLRHWRRR